MQPLKKHIESQDVQVEASPVEILDQMFDRALAECRVANELIGKRDAFGKGKAINRALEIIETLDMALDHTVAPELCACLESLYVFVQDKLQQANQHFDAAPLAEAMQILMTLKGAFGEASKKVRG